jgi:hypothetical protein
MRLRAISLVLLGVLLAGSLVASCGSSGGKRRVICDYAQDSGTFVGRLLTLAGPVATFTVERMHPNAAAVSTGRKVPVVGLPVTVHLDAGNEQYLRVGRDYKVKVWWLGDSPSKLRFVSSVHVAKQPCSGGIVYADGSAIAT